MVRADATRLEELGRQVRSELDRFKLTLNDVYRLTNTLQNSWDEQKCGSFREAMETVKGASNDVETGCIEILKLVEEMKDIARRYDSIRF